MSIAKAAMRAIKRPEPHPDPKVRAMRITGHENFDSLWKDGPWTRSQAYRWLSNQMGYNFHFGEAELDECRRAIRLTIDQLEKLGIA